MSWFEIPTQFTLHPQQCYPRPFNKIINHTSLKGTECSHWLFYKLEKETINKKLAVIIKC